MRFASLFLAATLAGFFPLLAHAEDKATFTDAQKTAIGDIIKDYLVNKNPEVLKDAMVELQKREQATSATKAKEAIAEKKDQLFDDPNAPVAGNPKGDVTVVEFFDYQCGYCKLAEPSVEKLLKEDKKVRFVFKEFPILSPQSVEAAKAALASVKQGKYQKFHDALMNKKDHFTSDMIYDIAKSVRLDVTQLKKDMDDPAIDKMLKDNTALGEAVGAQGTPLFVIGDQAFPGAMNYDQMKQAVSEARLKGKS